MRGDGQGPGASQNPTKRLHTKASRRLPFRPSFGKLLAVYGTKLETDSSTHHRLSIDQRPARSSVYRRLWFAESERA